MSRVYERKGRWYYNGNVDGQRVRRSLKTKNKREASEIMKRLDKSARERWLGLAHKKVYLVDFIDEYLEFSRTNKAPGSVLLDRNALNSLLDVLGNATLDKIGPQLIEGWKTERRKRVKAITVNKQLRHLKAAFKKAEDWEKIETSPFRRVKPIPIDEKTPATLSQEDIDALFEHLAERAKVPVWIALYTGMRLGEVANLYWADIDWKRRLVRIVNRDQFHTKSRKEGVAAIGEPLLDILNQTSRTDLRVWPYKAYALSKTFKRAVRRAGLPDEVHFHSLRHTYITDLANAGVPLWDVQQAARHSTISVTEGYAHFRAERLHEIAAKVDYRHKSGTK